VLDVEDWAEIRWLHRAEGMPVKAVARVMGVSKNTVKRALAAEGPPRYERRGRGSIVDAVEPRIRELLAAWPAMPATVIAERVGWTRGLTVFKDRVRELRPVYLPPDPASRTTYAAGEVVQCDLWFPEITLPVGFGQTRSATRLPVLVMVTGYARWLSARLLPSRCSEDLFAGWWQLISQLGGVPRVLVWDGEGAVGKRRRRVTVLTEQAHGFRGVLGAKIVICDPGDPEAKGLVERANGYLETSFLPGRVFASPADFNAQLADWLALANQRQRRHEPGRHDHRRPRPDQRPAHQQPGRPAATHRTPGRRGLAPPPSGSRAAHRRRQHQAAAHRSPSRRGLAPPDQRPGAGC
jgi:transposase